MFLELVRGADAVVEAMRPGGLDKRGVGYEACRAVNPRIVFCTISGYGMTGPVPGPAQPRHRLRHVGRAGRRRDHRRRLHRDAPRTRTSASTSARCSAPSASSAGITRARATGEGCALEIAQSDAAAVMDWLRRETYKAYERPESEVTGNKADGYERREPGTAGMRGGVRYQIYESGRRPRPVHGVGAGVLEELLRGRRPARPVRGAPRARKYADHARGNTELRAGAARHLPHAHHRGVDRASAPRPTRRSRR